MKIEWMEPYRDIIHNFYRSANGYSQICKNEFFGDPVKFSPYEIQIIEHIMENDDQHRNMKWYADQLGLNQATYSKYVQKLVKKGLIEKYHTSENKKNIILKVSALGLKEYKSYSKFVEKVWFHELFELLDSVSPKELELIKETFAILGKWHTEKLSDKDSAPVELIRIDE